MSNSPLSPVTSRRQCHLAFAALGVTSIALFWQPLKQLVELSLGDRPYSYIAVIPFISAFILYLERRREFTRAAFSPNRGFLFLAALLVTYALIQLRFVSVPAEYSLTIVAFVLVMFLAAAFSFSYGFQTLHAARFPFLLLLLMVPIPPHLMDRIVTGLQWGSAEATYVLFKLAGVPVFRDGVKFELPIVGIEVAEECSSIHSACALFITALLLGHLFLKRLGSKICLSVVAIPIAMFTNAVRIVSIWFLATKVDIGFLYGNLHRNGGILFSLISLFGLMGLLHLLQRLERGSQAHQNPSQRQSILGKEVGGLASPIADRIGPA